MLQFICVIAQNNRVIRCTVILNLTLPCVRGTHIYLLYCCVTFQISSEHHNMILSQTLCNSVLQLSYFNNAIFAYYYVTACKHSVKPTILVSNSMSLNVSTSFLFNTAKFLLMWMLLDQYLKSFRTHMSLS